MPNCEILLFLLRTLDDEILLLLLSTFVVVAEPGLVPGYLHI